MSPACPGPIRLRSLPTSSTTETTTPADPTVNVQIQGWEEYLARVGGVRRPLSGRVYAGLGTLLAGVVANHHTAALRVFGPDGQLAPLNGPDVACGDGLREMDLGPGTDEVSILNVDAAAEVHVVAFDGTLRRTIDLSAVSSDFYDFQRLAWSPDGSRLAVTTFDAKIWLVNSDGRSPQPGYTPNSGEDPSLETVIWGTTWSPDGSRLGFVEGHLTEADSKTPTLFQAISASCPDPDRTGPATRERCTTSRRLWSRRGTGCRTSCGRPTAVVWR